MFPNAPHHNDGALTEISWAEFFEKFDASGLALVYQEQTAEGAESDFNKLIHPDDEDHPAKNTAAKKTATKKTAAKKAPAKKTSAKKAAAKKSTH